MFAVIASTPVMSIMYGTRRCWASVEMLATCAEWKPPVSIWAPAPINRSASERATSALVSLSASSSSSFAPCDLMPPAALIASAAIWAPSRQSPPTSAMKPVMGLTTPTLMVFGCALRRSGTPATKAVVTAPLRNVRRPIRARVMTRVLRSGKVGPMVSLPPHARVVLGQLRAYRADIGMAARLDVGVALRGIAEVHAAPDTAHERARIADVRQPERVTQLVGKHLVEQRLAAGLPARHRGDDRDAHRQRNDAGAVGGQLGVSHQLRALRGLHGDADLRGVPARRRREHRHAHNLARQRVPVVEIPAHGPVEPGVVERLRPHGQREALARMPLAAGELGLGGASNDRECTDEKDDERDPTQDGYSPPSYLDVPQNRV